MKKLYKGFGFCVIVGAMLSCLWSCSSKSPGLLHGLDEGDYPLTLTSPSWSANNIVAYSDHGDRWLEGMWVHQTELEGIWTFNPLTGEKKHVVPFGEYPRWSPDGRNFIFWEPSKIWIYDLDSDEYSLLVDCGPFSNPGSWSPCGRLIAYSSAQAAPYDNTIWTYNLENGELENLTPGLGGLRYPVWTSGCDSLVHKRFYEEDGLPRSGIFCMAINTLQPTEVVSSDLDERGLAVSPQGRFIGFQVVDPDGTFRLNVFDRQNNEFVSGTGLLGKDMSWLPVGVQFLYVRSCSAGGSGVNSEVVLYTLETGDSEVLF
jgi:hypothetical protein